MAPPTSTRSTSRGCRQRTTATLLANDGALLREPGGVKQAGHCRRPGPGPPDTTAGPRRLEAHAGRSHATQTGTRRADGRDLRGAGQASRTAGSGGGSTAQGRGRRVARAAELLRGAAHDADGPNVQHVAAVAPDVLALSIQEKQFAPAPQVANRGATGRRNPSGRQGAGARCRERQSRGIAAGGDRPPEHTRATQDKLGHLAVNAKRIKPEDTAVGKDLTDETVAEPRAYRVAIVGETDSSANHDSRGRLVETQAERLSLAGSRSRSVSLQSPQPLAEGTHVPHRVPGRQCPPGVRRVPAPAQPDS